MYYNTTNETGSKLKSSRSKASRQKDVILNVFKRGTKLSPEDGLRYSQLNAPITSIRRAISDLTEEGLLIKTDTMKKGMYGKLVHTWRLKGKED